LFILNSNNRICVHLQQADVVVDVGGVVVLVADDLGNIGALFNSLSFVQLKWNSFDIISFSSFKFKLRNLVQRLNNILSNRKQIRKYQTKSIENNLSYSTTV
jgi:hypothetical protein